MSKPKRPILEVRVAFTVKDFERAVKFYCDGLGIEPAAIWNNGDGHAACAGDGTRGARTLRRSPSGDD
ncbi:MAG: hypothetical protein IT314_02495 [Anaerolineales bacterium]|nr:hypothetical protein [Anaerolineales bacterium]